ncbi:MAG: protein-methionine-sulfoxide reductase catalytic subunit MsrP [Ardenticatenales bacterium]
MERFSWRDITPEEVYLSRRRLLGVAAAAAGGAAIAACGPASRTDAPVTTGPTPTSGPPPVRTLSGALEPAAAEGAATDVARPATDELGAPLTSFDAVTHYNNFYEFSTNKEAVARLSTGFVASPWEIAIGGLVNKPMTLDLDALRTRFGLEERIYRLRCVEGWSIVVPWVGFPLRKLLAAVEPQSSAAFVRFESVLRPDQMPGQGDHGFPWPYTEGLRIDEAMNDLALLVTGVYGRDLLPQNGAPVRLVVPWKYGFKSIKSIVKIDLVADKPTTLWNETAPDEYGFFANVNPAVDHPRWSQATERRIEGGLSRRRTLPFNGYDAQVASLYTGMDLKVSF